MTLCFVISGVRVHKSSGDVDVFAKMVISDAGAINTFTKLLPKQISVKSRMFLKISVSCKMRT